MSTAQIRWGKLTRVSNDKGPYKTATFSVDGVDREIKVIEPFGVQANPMKDSQAMIICPDGDEGRAVALVMPPPAKRTDGQKEGEVSYVNPVTGNTIKFDADGHTTVTTPSGSISKHYKDGTIGVEPGSGQKVYLGKVDGAGCAKVVTVSGPSANVYAKV